jgi:succinyl-diaminopimelate desuccinylase
MTSDVNIASGDALNLARAMIRCPSVTPKDGGTLDVLQKAAEALGFVCHRQVFGSGDEAVDNLYARLGAAAPNFCFAGHTDVVPVGDGWTTDPFAADVTDGTLYGRGASDMKSAIAAFLAAVARFQKTRPKENKLPGSISLLITGDEEGDAVNGTVKMLEWLEQRGERLDACVVGEPTNPTKLGEMVKIGRRGSLTAKVTAYGTPGHSAYPHLADNPIPRLMAMLSALTAEPLDQGTAHFQPSTIAITTIDVGNRATNVIPGNAKAGFNIRFNDLHTGASLTERIKATFDRVATPAMYDVEIKVSGEAFLTPPGPLSSLVADAVKAVIGTAPELSTTGGTSDARFIRKVCPVCEFGMVGMTMHKANEQCTLADLEALTAIYLKIIESYFAARQ